MELLKTPPAWAWLPPRVPWWIETIGGTQAGLAAAVRFARHPAALERPPVLRLLVVDKCKPIETECSIERSSVIGDSRSHRGFTVTRLYRQRRGSRLHNPAGTNFKLG